MNGSVKRKLMILKTMMMKTTKPIPVRWISIDDDFHQVIARNSSSHLVKQVVRVVREQIAFLATSNSVSPLSSIE
jgi:DNA-binding FadR family transcriptional regulator